MRRLIFQYTLNHRYYIQRAGTDSQDEIAVVFAGGWEIFGRNNLRFREGALEGSGIDWIWQRGREWYVDFDVLKARFETFRDLDWLKGIAPVQPDIEEYPTEFSEGRRRFLEFKVYREEFVVDRKRKIFLSHKGADKPMVRQFFRVLKAIGLDPWLDEDAMVAGTPLERGILDGFEQSCAAVFFVTPNFQDENFLATEVNYAVAQKRKKGDRFAIITIVLKDKKEKGRVPALLEQYVWKEPSGHLEALEEVLRSLPIETGEPRWRAHINPA
jgi:hypothetical protein